MKLNKNTALLVLATALSVTSLTTMAAGSNSVSVKFTGEIADSPCTINGSGGSINPVIDLGSVKQTAFAQSGAETDKVGFNLKLSNCTPGALQDIEIKHTAPETSPGKITMSDTNGTSADVALQIFPKGVTTPLQNGQPITIGKLATGNTILDLEANMISLTNTVGQANLHVDVPLLITYK